MRKCIHWVSLALAAAGVLWAAALTAGAREEIAITDKFSGSTAKFVEGDDSKIQVTVTSPSITPEEQYLIVMVQGRDESPVITERNILSLDQKTAGEASGGGTLTVELYPSGIQDSVILISGAAGGETGPAVLAVVNAGYLLGDVNGDGEVNVADALIVLQYSVSLCDNVDERAADVNQNGSATSADASLILQYSIGLNASLV